MRLAHGQRWAAACYARTVRWGMIGPARVNGRPTETMLLLIWLVVGLGLALALLELIIRKPVSGAAVTFLYVAIEHSGAIPPQLFNASVYVSPGDAVAALLATAAIARFLRLRRLTAADRLLLVVVAATLYSTLSGVLIFRQSAVSEARPWVYLLSTTAYFATVRLPQRRLDVIARYWVWAAVAVMTVAYLRWAALAGGLPAVSVLAYDGGDLRVVRARETLLIAQATLILLPLWRSRSHLWYRWLGVAMLVTVLVMRHRTLWIAVVCALLVMLLKEPGLARRFGALLVVGVLVGGGLFTVLLGGDQEQADASASPDSFEWRLEGWTTLMANEGPRTPGEVVLGLPFGSGWGREVGGSTTEVQIRPHSQYIEAGLRTGAVGLVALVACYWLLITRLWRRDPNQRDAGGLLTPDALLYLLIVQAAFSVTYHLEWTGGVVLGLAVATYARRSGFAPIFAPGGGDGGEPDLPSVGAASR